VLRGGSHCAAGGEGREVRVWDVERQQCVFEAKPPPKDWLGMYVRIYCAAASFAGGDGAHATLLVGGEREARLFDFRAQRRAVRSFALADKGLATALAPAPDGASFVAGSSRGVLAQFDLRGGGLLGALKGVAGALRSASQHPSLPLVAVAGLDRHVRVFSTRTRLQQLALFVKQPCTAIAWDSHSAAHLAAEAAAAEAAAAAAAAPKPARKDKRTGAVIERMAAAAAGAEPAQPRAPKRKKARAGSGLMLNLVTEA